MIGRLLWISRCIRPDISLACSTLGSRVNSWNKECELELARTIGYLAGTSHLALEFRWPKQSVDEDKIHFDLFTDSDWCVPKSQSAFFGCIWLSAGDSEDEVPYGFLPIHYGSKRQKVGADAVSAAEIIAAHVGLKSGGLPMISAVDVFGVPNSKLVVRVDNNAALRHITNSASDSVFFLLRGVNSRHSLLRDCHRAGVFGCTKVPTKLNRSDLGTKALSRLDLERARRMAGLVIPDGSIDPTTMQWERYNVNRKNNKMKPQTAMTEEPECAYFSMPSSWIL